MAYQIIWTENARVDLLNILDYLEKEWSTSVAENFIEKLYFKLDILSISPFIGIASKKYLNVRKILITNHNFLYYSISGKDIVLLDFFDTRQNPDKIIY